MTTTNTTEMHGRRVVTCGIPTPHDYKCADCNCPAVVLVLELGELNQWQERRWPWCGACDVGE